MRRICNETDELSLSTTEPTMEANYIGFLNEYCQKNKKNVPQYRQVGKIGPPHSPQYVSSGKEYGRGEIKFSKMAEQFTLYLRGCSVLLR